MLLVKTKIGPSSVHGTGLFADELIRKGVRIWEFNSDADKAYTKNEVEQMPEPNRSDILGLHYAYLSKQTGRYVVCGDNAKFMNHSFVPSVVSVYEPEDKEDVGYAARDIQPGEELTVDYRTFDEEIDFL